MPNVLKYTLDDFVIPVIGTNAYSILSETTERSEFCIYITV